VDSGSSHRRWSQNSRSQILGALSSFKKKRKLTLLLPLKTRMEKQIALIGKPLARLNLYLRTLLRNNWELEELVQLEEM
jgi:hypothetical protein